MDKGWKTGVMSAIAAFGVSVFFGILGGVGFGTLLARALAGAAVFAGLGYGASMIVRRFLPELFSSASTTSDGGVDILLPDVNPHGSGALEPGAPGPGVLSADEGEEEFFLKEVPGPLEPVDEPVEEAADLPLSEDVTGRRAADPPKSSRARTAEPEDEGPEPLQELETLPDVGALETAFSPAPREAATGAELSGDPGDKDRGKDPVLLAKVVQTLLRKEKEG